MGVILLSGVIIMYCVMCIDNTRLMVVSCGGDWLVLYCVEWMVFLVLLQLQCTHTQLLLLATVLVFHSLTAFVSSLPQVQTSHAALGPREDY